MAQAAGCGDSIRCQTYGTHGEYYANDVGICGSGLAAGWMEDVCQKNAGPDDSSTTELSDEPCEVSNAYADVYGPDGQAVHVVIPLGGDDCTRTRDFYPTPHI